MRHVNTLLKQRDQLEGRGQYCIAGRIFNCILGLEYSDIDFILERVNLFNQRQFKTKDCAIKRTKFFLKNYVWQIQRYRCSATFIKLGPACA